MSDQAVLDWVVGIRTPWLTSVFTAISVVGGTVAIAVITVVIALVLYRRGRGGDGLALVVVGFTGWLLMNAIKFIVTRPRPPMPPRLTDISTYSWPSGHAMVSAVFAASVTLIAVRHRRALVGVLLGVWSMLIGVSRIYLGVHWISDVLAGWTFGVLWAVIGYRLWRRLSSGQSALGSPGSATGSRALRTEQAESDDADADSSPAGRSRGFEVGTAEIHRDSRHNP